MAYNLIILYQPKHDGHSPRQMIKGWCKQDESTSSQNGNAGASVFVSNKSHKFHNSQHTLYVGIGYFTCGKIDKELSLIFWEPRHRSRLSRRQNKGGLLLPWHSQAPPKGNGGQGWQMQQQLSQELFLVRGPTTNHQLLTTGPQMLRNYSGCTIRPP